jgi:hypothetical protein
MRKHIVLLMLTLITMTGAVLEGLVADFSPQMVQINGLLTLVSAIALITWALSIQSADSPNTR